MISFNQLTKRFGDKVAVNNLNLTVQDGEIFGFLGPNGAGKTTTIKMLVGLLEPSTGQISVNNIDVRQNPLEAKRLLSYVPDNPDIYDKMTGKQYLDFLGAVYNLDPAMADKTIRYYADLFEITDALNDLIGSYSHGMKQKLVLVGALFHNPHTLVLDEPMVGLDPKSSFNLKEIMRQRCSQGLSVFFSTHVMEVAEKICDRIAIINHGNIIAVGTMDELRAMAHGGQTLEELFLELTNE
ncbi:MAG: ABC transporter ATP-binding protein [Tissierellia bacterium]|nr:ABC transporter ATP-binding protein [Tissierellia bacterium]